MVGHNQIARKLTFELVTVKIKAIPNWYNKRRTGENPEATVDVGRYVENRTFHPYPRVHLTLFENEHSLALENANQT